MIATPHLRSIDPPRLVVFLSDKDHTYTTALDADALAVHFIDRDRIDLADRITVMLQGELVSTVAKLDVTMDQVLAMIILGKRSEDIDESDIASLH